MRGCFAPMTNVEFLAPVYAGDFIEVSGRITRVGRTSRQLEFEAWKVIVPRPDISDSAADLLEEPILVCKASGTCVTLQERAAKRRLEQFTPGCRHAVPLSSCRILSGIWRSDRLNRTPMVEQ